MKNKPTLLVSTVVVALIAITAVATVTSTTPKPVSAPATAPSDTSTNVEAVSDASAADNATGTVNSTAVKPRQAPAKAAQPTKIAWETSFEAALQKGKATGKPVMVDFYAVWCGACKHLDENIYTASPVIAESGNFINVKVDADKRTDLQEKFQVSGLPTIVWFNSLGTEVKRLQGAPGEADYMVEMMREARSKAAPDSVL